MYIISIICIIFFHSLYPFTLGIENSSDSFFATARDKKYKVILITNQTGITQKKERSVDVLLTHGITIVSIAAPEHGFEGTVEAGKDVHHHKDTKTGIPVISLYKNCSGQIIDPADVAQCDAFCFDIQDCGMRHYTFVSTLYTLFEAALVHDKKIIVFDRPNFLGPVVAGPVVDSSLISFISIAPIPLRYGLTVGELARYYNHYFFEQKVKLHVVPMRDYSMLYCPKVGDFTSLSPNIKTTQACYGYSFLGIVGEVRPFDVGIGTDKAFSMIMLPQSLGVTHEQWSVLKNILQGYYIASNHYRYYSERKKTPMEGLALFIDTSDITKVSSFAVVLEILQWAMDCSVSLTCGDGFNKAVGNKLVQEGIIKKKIDKVIIMAGARNECTPFINNAQRCLLYNQKLVLR